MKLHRDVYQDGPDFYHEETGFLVTYPGTVKNDYDMEGAIEARLRFAKDFPHFVDDSPEYPSVMDSAATPFCDNH